MLDTCAVDSQRVMLYLTCTICRLCEESRGHSVGRRPRARLLPGGQALDVTPQKGGGRVHARGSGTAGLERKFAQSETQTNGDNTVARIMAENTESGPLH